MERSRRCGFTLVELLVVITIIGLLMALAFPALQVVRKTARKIECSSHLAEIGKAYHHYVTKQGSITKLKPPAWTTMLLPYLDDQEKIYLCPEDNERHFTDITGYYYYMPQSNISKERPLDGSAGMSLAFRDLNGEYQTDVGTWGNFQGKTWYQVIKECGYPYTPSEGAWVFTTCDGADFGIDDLYFLIDLNCPDGPRGYCFLVWFQRYPGHIKSRETGNVVTGYSQTSGNSVAMSPIVAKTWWPMDIGLRASYGINGRVNRFGGDSDKVLAVEYCQLVAKLAGPGATDRLPTDLMKNSPNWTGWGGGRARHTGMINVLFGDGRVESLRPDSINPLLTTNDERYWVPNADLPK